MVTYDIDNQTAAVSPCYFIKKKNIWYDLVFERSTRFPKITFIRSNGLIRKLDGVVTHNGPKIDTLSSVKRTKLEFLTFYPLGTYNIIYLSWIIY